MPSAVPPPPGSKVQGSEAQAPQLLGVALPVLRDLDVQIEALLGTPVYLDLHVKIAKDWQRDPKQLRRLGF